MLSLKDKTILVTGASSGIGRACARQCAAQGANLILCARRLDRLRDLADELHRASGVRTLPLELDITNFERVDKAIGGLPEEWRRVDVLINNAGISLHLDKVQEARISDWDKMIDTNIKGLLYVTRLILPGMIERDSGHIVNLGSIAALETYPAGNVYCATKSAVKALSQAMRLDVNGTAVRVTLVEPGMTKTEFALVRWDGDEQKASAMYEGVDHLTPEDVAEVIVFCLTRPARDNIADVVLTPTQQASIYVTHRRKQPSGGN